MQIILLPLNVAIPLIKWVDYRCRAEFIRPTAIITLGDKEVTMSCDALRGAMLFPLRGL